MGETREKPLKPTTGPAGSKQPVQVTNPDLLPIGVALPFGVASGAGAEAGIYGALLVGLFAALFGGTPTLFSEPTGPMTVVMATVMTTLIAANPEKGMVMAFTVAMMAGVSRLFLHS